MSSPWEVVSDNPRPRGDNPMGSDYFGWRTTELVTPDSKKLTYSGLLVGSCVHVVAVSNTLDLYMVQQHRPNARQQGSLDVPLTLELPGGFAEDELLASARKELNEETGMDTNDLKAIGNFYTNPGATDEIDHIFLGTNIQPLAERSSSDEDSESDLQLVIEPFGKLYDALTSGIYPTSAQTIAALTLAERHL